MFGLQKKGKEEGRKREKKNIRDNWENQKVWYMDMENNKFVFVVCCFV